MSARRHFWGGGTPLFLRMYGNKARVDEVEHRICRPPLATWPKGQEVREVWYPDQNASSDQHPWRSDCATYRGWGVTDCILNPERKLHAETVYSLVPDLQGQGQEFLQKVQWKGIRDRQKIATWGSRRVARAPRRFPQKSP